MPSSLIGKYVKWTWERTIEKARIQPDPLGIPNSGHYRAHQIKCSWAVRSVSGPWSLASFHSPRPSAKPATLLSIWWDAVHSLVGHKCCRLVRGTSLLPMCSASCLLVLAFVVRAKPGGIPFGMLSFTTFGKWAPGASLIAPGFCASGPQQDKEMSIGQTSCSWGS